MVSSSKLASKGSRRSLRGVDPGLKARNERVNSLIAVTLRDSVVGY